MTSNEDTKVIEFPSFNSIEPTENGSLPIPLDAIDENANNPRKDFDPNELQQLKAAIRSVGLLQPILVQPKDDGRYLLIAGHRRLHAYRELRAEGADGSWDSICAITTTDRRATGVAASLLENTHRSNLSPFEVGNVVAEMLGNGDKVEDIVALTGWSKSSVTRYKQVAASPKWLQKFLKKNENSEGLALSHFILVLEFYTLIRRKAGLSEAEGRQEASKIAKSAVDSGWSRSKLRHQIEVAKLRLLEGGKPKAEVSSTKTIQSVSDGALVSFRKAVDFARQETGSEAALLKNLNDHFVKEFGLKLVRVHRD